MFRFQDVVAVLLLAVVLTLAGWFDGVLVLIDYVGGWL